MKRIKICFLTDTWFPVFGGGTQVVWQYGQILTREYPCRVDIITRKIDGSSIPFEVSQKAKKTKGLRIIRFGPGGSWNSLSSRILFIIQSFFHLLKNDYDFIHAFPFISYLPAFLISRLKKKPLIFSIFALRSQKTSKNNFSERLNIFLENFLSFYLKADLLITDNREFFEKNKRLKRLIYIPNGVDINLFESLKVKKPNYPRIIFVGRYHPQKGIENLLKSLPVLIKKFPDLKCVFIGWGPLKGYLTEEIKRKNLQKNIEIENPKYGKRLVKEYKKSHLLVLPSLYEGGGIVILEAWAARIPVIATRVGSLKYLVENGKNGYLVRVNHPEELETAITKLLRSKRRIKMGENGFDLVKREFTWQKVVAKLYKQYEKKYTQS